MNRLNKTEAAVFLCCRYSLILRDPFSEIIRFFNSFSIKPQCSTLICDCVFSLVIFTCFTGGEVTFL